MTTTVPQVRFSPRRIAHANLFVGELERSIAFYNRFCGIELVYREPGVVAGFLTNGNTQHDVGLMQVTGAGQQRTGIGGYVQIPTGRGRTPGLNHLAWEMEHEAALVEAWRRARAAGVEIHRTSDHQVAHSVYVFDPDGNVMEFYADVVKDWRSVFNLESQDPSTGAWDPGAGTPRRERNYWMTPEIRRVPEALFHCTRMHHAVLVARDYAAMYDFYAEIAGLAVVRESAAGAVLKGAASSWYDLVLLAPRAGWQPGLHHVAFEIGDMAELDASIAAVRGRPAVERLVDDRYRRSAFVRDPDGMLVELFCRKALDGYPMDGAPADLQPWMV